jgi:hypothetical protein
VTLNGPLTQLSSDADLFIRVLGSASMHWRSFGGHLASIGEKAREAGPVEALVWG